MTILAIITGTVLLALVIGSVKIVRLVPASRPESTGAPEYPFPPGFTPRLDGRASVEQLERQAAYFEWAADTAERPADRSRFAAWAERDRAQAMRQRDCQ